MFRLPWYREAEIESISEEESSGTEGKDRSIGDGMYDMTMTIRNGDYLRVASSVAGSRWE